MNDLWFFLRFWYRVLILVVLFLILRALTANAADHAIVSFDGYELYADTVSFDNQADLIAKTKEVVEVCDTTWWELRFTQTKADSAIISVQLGDSLLADSVRFYPYDIACRRLVGVTVTEQTRTIPNAEYESVYTWERPLPYHVFDPPDSVKEAEWKILNTKWLDRLSKTPEFITIPGKAIIFCERSRR